VGVIIGIFPNYLLKIFAFKKEIYYFCYTLPLQCEKSLDPALERELFFIEI